MNKLKEIIENLDHHELILIKKDLAIGNIERLINKRIELTRTSKGGVCPVCNTDIKDIEDDRYTLFFGPKGLRKKATFCAIDCMLYFIERLKDINMKKVKGEH